MILILAFLACFPSQAAEKKWVYPQATFRVSFNALSKQKPHSLRIDLPVSYRQNIKDVVACLSDETLIPAEKITSAGQLKSAEVFFSEDTLASIEKRKDKPLLSGAVYVFPDSSGVDKPNPPHKNVRFRGRLNKMLTRPFTFYELRAWRAKQGLLPFRGNQSQIQLLSRFKEKDAFKKRNRAFCAHWSARLIISNTDDKTLRLAMSEPDTPWFVFYEGQPLFAWRNFAKRQDTQQGKLVMGKPVQPQTSSSRIDVFAFPRSAKGVPHLYWAKAGETFNEVSSDKYTASKTPEALQIAWKDGKTTRKLIFPRPRIHRFPAVDASVKEIVVKTTTGKDGNYKLIPQVTKPKRAALGTSKFLEDKRAVAFELPVLKDKQQVGTVRLPPRKAWPEISLQNLRLRLTDVPIILEKNQEIELTCRIENFEESFSSISEAEKKLRVRQLSQNGRELDTTTYKMDASSEKNMTFKCDRNTRKLKIGLLLGQTNTKMASAVSARILTPSSTFPPISPRDNKLFVKNTRTPVVLRVEGVSRDTFYNDEEDNAETALQLSENGNLLMVDELCSGRAFPGESPDFGDMVAKTTAIQDVQHFPVFRKAKQVATKDLQKFRLLARISEQNPDIVIWNVGISDLREDVPVERLRRRLLFLSRFSREREMKPVFMTPPKAVPGITPQKIYETALMMKQLGIQRDLPVVDAFSRSRHAFKNQDADADLNPFFYATKDGQQYLLQTLNRRGRVFYAELLKEKFHGETAATSD